MGKIPQREGVTQSWRQMDAFSPGRLQVDLDLSRQIGLGFAWPEVDAMLKML